MRLSPRTPPTRAPRPCSPEPQRLWAPQDGKAEPAEGLAGQLPPALEPLGSLAPAVLWGADERPKRAEGRALACQPTAPATVDYAPPPGFPFWVITCGRGGNSCHHGLMSDLVGDGVHELRGQGGQLDEGGAWGAGLM